MRHMNEKDRYFIEKALKRNVSVKEIAAALGFSRQSIYAEIRKGQTIQRDTDLKEKTVYLADVGEQKHKNAMKNTGRPNKLSPDDEYLLHVKKWIYDKKYSPWAAQVKIGKRKVCTKTIYNYVHKGYIAGLCVQNLPYAHPHKKKKEKVVKRAFSRGRSIENRPKNILNRDTFGHWEMDTVYSSKTDKACLLVLSERMTRKEIVIKVKDRTTGCILNGLNSLERKFGAPRFRQVFKTITCDNGMEFADWHGIEKSKLNKGQRTTVYFCHPYCSSERGTNENINRMIRRWIPKGDDIGLYSMQEVRDIQDWINDYPRKIFGGLSANEYFSGLQFLQT